MLICRPTFGGSHALHFSGKGVGVGGRWKEPPVRGLSTEDFVTFAKGFSLSTRKAKDCALALVKTYFRSFKTIARSAVNLKTRVEYSLAAL
jgi:hypothetical protein